MSLNISGLHIQHYGVEGNPPIVFVGGWGVSTEDYKSRLENLATHFRVYSISLPGFGDNEPLEVSRNNIAGQSEFIRNAVEDIISQYDRVFLMGHSTGAAVATFLATYFPEKVSRLVLVSPVGSPDPLSKSFMRMLKVINMREVLKYNTAHYRRRAIANIRLGIDAKYIDLSPRIYQAMSSGVPVDLFLADNDMIAPPGKLADLENANIFWVEGGHSWFKHDDEAVVLNHLIRYIPKDNGASKKIWSRSAWLRFVNILFEPASKLLKNK